MDGSACRHVGCRFKLENEGKNPSAGRLADEVGGSRSWWLKFLEQDQESFSSTHVGPTDSTDQSGTPEDPRLPKQGDAGTGSEASLKDVSLQSMEVEGDAKQARGDGVQEVKKGDGGGRGNGLGKDGKKNPPLPTSALNGIEALDFPGGGNNQVLPKDVSGKGQEEEEVEEEEEEEEEEVSRGVHIKRIPSRTTEEELLKVMQDLGPVVEVRLPQSNISSSRSTYGFAYFKVSKRLTV